MKIEQAWKQFALSGKINDYLNYKQLKEKQENDNYKNTAEYRCISNQRDERR
jgi:hypothetical protein